MSEPNLPVETPAWLDGKSVNEVVFCSEFLQNNPLVSVGGRFFSLDGQVHDESPLKKKIYDILKTHITSNLPKKVASLLEVIRMECAVEELPLHTDRIHVANGTLFLNGELREKKEFCQARFPVAANLSAGRPEIFLSFVGELFYEEDIAILQEFFGYCLLPCTKAQKMMIILGKGGEGKSRLGLILKNLLGAGVTMNSIQKIETNKFARADLEGRLVMVDDDMEMTALPKTSVLKTLVTAESAIDLEKKGVQSYQGQLYARFLCFGNGELTSVSDQSFGFYRRQLVLYTKDPPPGRKNDPYLVEKMEPEMDAILMWALGGLSRLIRNNFQFTVSPRAKKNLEAIQSSVNTVEAFMESTSYFVLDPNANTCSRSLYAAYSRFCSDNLFDVLSPRTFIKQLHRIQGKYGLQYGNNSYNSAGTRVWGFTGIKSKYEFTS